MANTLVNNGLLQTGLMGFGACTAAVSLEMDSTSGVVMGVAALGTGAALMAHQRLSGMRQPGEASAPAAARLSGGVPAEVVRSRLRAELVERYALPDNDQESPYLQPLIDEIIGASAGHPYDTTYPRLPGLIQETVIEGRIGALIEFLDGYQGSPDIDRLRQGLADGQQRPRAVRWAPVGVEETIARELEDYRSVLDQAGCAEAAFPLLVQEIHDAWEEGGSPSFLNQPGPAIPLLESFIEDELQSLMNGLGARAKDPKITALLRDLRLVRRRPPVAAPAVPRAEEALHAFETLAGLIGLEEPDYAALRDQADRVVEAFRKIPEFLDASELLGLTNLRGTEADLRSLRDAVTRIPSLRNKIDQARRKEETDLRERLHDLALVVGRRLDLDSLGRAYPPVPAWAQTEGFRLKGAGAAPERHLFLNGEGVCADLGLGAAEVKIAYHVGGWWLRDGRSANPLNLSFWLRKAYVNGRALRPGTSFALKKGDKIRIGIDPSILEFAPPDEPPPEFLRMPIVTALEGLSAGMHALHAKYVPVLPGPEAEKILVAVAKSVDESDSDNGLVEVLREKASELPEAAAIAEAVEAYFAAPETRSLEGITEDFGVRARVVFLTQKNETDLREETARTKAEAAAEIQRKHDEAEAAIEAAELKAKSEIDQANDLAEAVKAGALAEAAAAQAQAENEIREAKENAAAEMAQLRLETAAAMESARNEAAAKVAASLERLRKQSQVSGERRDELIRLHQEEIEHLAKENRRHSERLWNDHKAAETVIQMKLNNEVRGLENLRAEKATVDAELTTAKGELAAKIQELGEERTRHTNKLRKKDAELAQAGALHGSLDIFFEEMGRLLGPEIATALNDEKTDEMQRLMLVRHAMDGMIEAANERAEAALRDAQAGIKKAADDAAAKVAASLEKLQKQGHVSAERRRLLNQQHAEEVERAVARYKRHAKNLSERFREEEGVIRAVLAKVEEAKNELDGRAQRLEAERDRALEDVKAKQGAIAALGEEVRKKDQTIGTLAGSHDLFEQATAVVQKLTDLLRAQGLDPDAEAPAEAEESPKAEEGDIRWDTTPPPQSSLPEVPAALSAPAPVVVPVADATPPTDLASALKQAAESTVPVATPAPVAAPVAEEVVAAGIPAVDLTFRPSGQSENDDVFTLGSQEDELIARIPHESVSPQHVELHYDPKRGVWFLRGRDAETLVNGEKLEMLDCRDLTDGIRILLGRVPLVVSLGEGDAIRLVTDPAAALPVKNEDEEVELDLEELEELDGADLEEVAPIASSPPASAFIGGADPRKERVEIPVMEVNILANSEGAVIGSYFISAGGQEGSFSQRLSDGSIISGQTSRGGRSHQEDGILIATYRLQDGTEVKVFAGADGAGGMRAGDIASSAFLQGIHAAVVDAAYRQAPVTPKELWSSGHAAAEKQKGEWQIEEIRMAAEEGRDPMDVSKASGSAAIIVIIGNQLTGATAGDSLVAQSRPRSDDSYETIGYSDSENIGSRCIITNGIHLDKPRLYQAALAKGHRITLGSDGQWENLIGGEYKTIGSSQARRLHESGGEALPPASQELFRNLNLAVEATAGREDAGIMIHDLALNGMQARRERDGDGAPARPRIDFLGTIVELPAERDKDNIFSLSYEHGEVADVPAVATEGYKPLEQVVPYLPAIDRTLRPRGESALDNLFVLGSQEDEDIVHIPHESVSPKHAEVHYLPDRRVWAFRAWSSDGAVMNGEQLDMMDWRDLADGTKLLLGSVPLIISLGDGGKSIRIRTDPAAL